MIKRKLSEIADAISGEVESKYCDLVISGVSVDTRLIQPRILFIPLQGKNSDGHQYVEEAIASGASAALWEKQMGQAPKNIPLIFVNSALGALQDLARFYIESLCAVTIGVTGSNGKTTTKDLIASVLKKTFIVHKTEGNHNNHIGLPLSILRAPQNCEVLILEMGMSKRGEISFLSKLAKPHLGVITSIGDAHLLELGSREKIADEKCDILEGMSEDATLFYFGDEPLLKERTKTLLRKQSFGYEKSNDFYPESITSDISGIKFFVSDRSMFIPILGDHNVMNALAAIAVARDFNLSWEEIAEGLKNAELTGMRLELLRGKNNESILNDTYNSNPDSILAALKLVNSLQGFNRKIVVFADMLQLGTDEVKFHRMAGENIDPKEIDLVYTFGSLAKHIAEGARKNFLEDRVFHHTDKKELGKALKLELREKDLVIIKGSRGMYLEEIVETLTH